MTAIQLGEMPAVYPSARLCLLWAAESPSAELCVILVESRLLMLTASPLASHSWEFLGFLLLLTTDLL